MKIETLEISGFRSALEALRLPYSLEPRSELSAHCALIPAEDLPGKLDSTIYDSSFISISNLDISKKDINLMSTLVKRGDEHAKVLRGVIVWVKITAPLYMWAEIETYRAGHERLGSESTMHTEGKGLSGEKLQKVKAEIPSGRELTKIDYFSYQTLRRIYFQRRNHRLPEWLEFCEYIKTLPYSEEFITIENVNN